ncbi:hypothetical protein [Salinirubrum litoreum]|uniref:Uncharacterized protein n=1 Tax=Salinirubrum litoreum TaxID=1126234 RepID=A0ABD5R6R7_9EURY|nr:hypothetical protein [Salinirubrum litoreum]
MSDDGTTVACPVEGCAFRDTASLVAAHVNGSEAPGHDWHALRFGGPRDFLQQARRGWLDDEAEGDEDEANRDVADSADAERSVTDDEPDRSTETEREGTGTAGGGAAEPGSVPVGQVRCPADGCHYTGELASVKAHVSGTRDAAHDAERLRERGIYPTEDDVKGGVGSGDSTDSGDGAGTTTDSAGTTTDSAETTTDRADADASASTDTTTERETTTTDDTTTATTTATTSPATTSASEESPESEVAAGTADSTKPTDATRITGDTTVAELLDLLDAAESRDLPVDTSAVETALVLCDLLSDLAEDPDTRTLVDAYTLASDLSSEAGDARTDLRDELLARTDTDGELAGEVGRVRRVTRTRRSLKDDDEVLARLREAGVDETSVLRPDSKRVRETLDAADLPESLAFDVSESNYVQKSDSDADAKQTRLAALRRRSEE